MINIILEITYNWYCIPLYEACNGTHKLHGWQSMIDYTMNVWARIHWNYRLNFSNVESDIYNDAYSGNIITYNNTTDKIVYRNMVLYSRRSK